jgi:two-component system chemotaxis sensor kinase CheA
MRMLPIKFAFNRMHRLVHDLSAQLGKRVVLRLSGEQTELDKTVLEKIGDPLVHLVRNSLDHGLETPEARRASGKPEEGLLHLSAFHRGGNIIIQIEDDGAGLNVEKIEKRARERGLLAATDRPTPEQLQYFIFQPGFSTAEAVSEVSGRGVGLDVVARNIKLLGGHIQLRSVPGQGTTFTIRLPLTMAILDAQMVRVGTGVYILPLISIVESLQVRAAAVTSLAGRVEIYSVRGEPVPILRLARLLRSHVETGASERSDGQLLVVVEADGRRFGLIVDDLLEQQQVVIKSLESNYKRVPGVSGATILGDGTVALILDVGGLIELVDRRHVATPTTGTGIAQSA